MTPRTTNARENEDEIGNFHDFSTLRFDDEWTTDEEEDDVDRAIDRERRVVARARERDARDDACVRTTPQTTKDGNHRNDLCDENSTFELTLGSTTTIRVKQKPHQELGTVVWNAAVILCARAREREEIARGLDVLDIGAGTGVAGFLCAESLGARTVTITDCGPKTMLNLAETLAMVARERRMKRVDADANADADVDDRNDGAPWASKRLNIKLRRHLWEEDLEIENARASGENVAPLRVRHWSNAGMDENVGSFAPTLEPDATFDAIIGSDLLYFSSQEASLLAAIRLRLRPHGTCTIVQTLRENTRDVFDRFIARAQEHFSVNVAVIGLPTADASTLAKETPHVLADEPYRLVTLKRVV